jgi:hypothetical protein
MQYGANASYCGIGQGCGGSNDCAEVFMSSVI